MFGRFGAPRANIYSTAVALTKPERTTLRARYLTVVELSYSRAVKVYVKR